ncbi:hypothetical protein [Pseudonocardia acaciae]|uniref:hypothetical protein n=1 Tax=Pseudonocardia acaciae TaxID=551276 RepID=UPI00055E4B7A|nr:hypothetical protein [Pseudonocardia acaciae]
MQDPPHEPSGMDPYRQQRQPSSAAVFLQMCSSTLHQRSWIPWLRLVGLLALVAAAVVIVKTYA